MPPEITAIECAEFTYPLEGVTTGPDGVNLAYAPGETYRRRTLATRIHTSDGNTGKYVGGAPTSLGQIKQVAPTLIGENPLERERHWRTMRRVLRQYDGCGIGPLDIALWDLAGKRYDAPIHELLGTYRRRLPSYASTYFAIEGTGFDSPAAYADFADLCLDRGFPAFKTHTWCGLPSTNIDREIAVIEAVRERVGDTMELMHDPVCEYDTFSTALQVGRACDDNDYLWYEDPYADGGRSQHGASLLRDRLDTPLLQTELVRGLEPHIDFIAASGTDLCRADVEWDGGITGAMKIARAAEGLGVDVEFHLANPATRHCMAATRNTNYYELGLIHPESKRPHTQPPVYTGGYSDAPTDIDEDGTVLVPSGPGLGVGYDWSFIDENTTRRVAFER